ncbi:hypothetical protein M9H77_23203 [Catharanthus roseus]|uniref:Uncharacterized protein n=1 Tax=Catharanthus roseus TaxID=4058 RepID=A0ACC0ASN3_CATRO|nr:hypothetical protein M9H77_23203 [Catharanthus roseus]
MTLNFQAMNILSCALDASEYNRVNGCDSAHEMWKLLEVTHEGTNQVKESKLAITDHLVADCPKALEKEKGALEAKLEALKKKKKGKGLIGTWDQDSSENEEEEKANICFMALENEVQSSPPNSSSILDDDCDVDPSIMLIEMYDECKKVTKRNKDLKSKTQFLLDENSKLICENKAILESLEVLKKEK